MASMSSEGFARSNLGEGMAVISPAGMAKPDVEASASTASGSTPRIPKKTSPTAASPRRTPRLHSPGRNSLTPKSASGLPEFTSPALSNPSSRALLHLEDELKVKEAELTKALTESKTLRQIHISMEKAVASLTQEAAKLKEKLAMAEKQLEDKALDLKQSQEQRRAALSDAAAAEATVRRLQAAMKDPTDDVSGVALAAVEAELKLAHREIVRLQDEIKTQDKQMKTKELALMGAEREIAIALSKANRVDELENRVTELNKLLEISQDEIKTVNRMYKQKVEEVKEASDKIKELEEALLVAGAVTSVVKDYERQLQETQASQKTLNEELARAKVAATRVAMAVANEFKDDNDKVIPVKQWLDERRFMQGEMSRLKEKLALAEKANRYEIQMKNKAQARLKVIEDSLKSQGKAVPPLASRTSNSRTARSSSGISTDLTEDIGERVSDDGCQPSEEEEMVAAVLYDTLQKEVVSLRKTLRERESALNDKESSHDMLAKKVELLMRAMDVDSRRYRREVSILKEEVATLKIELQARGPRRSSPGSKLSRG